LQAKIKKLARHVQPSHTLHLEPLSTFTNVKEGEQNIDQGDDEIEVPAKKDMQLKKKADN
jgi:hypothetical protein